MKGLEELERLANAATRGEWQVHDSCSWRRIGTQEGDGNILRPTNDRDGQPNLHARREDLDYIAAASPDVIISLIRELKIARKALENAVEESSRRNGEWLCAVDRIEEATRELYPETEQPK